MIGALIAGGAALAGHLINARQQRRNIEDQKKANLELAKYQYSKDLEMWNKGNAYNDPSAQMQRLKSANLNPNLVYGGGNVSGNAAGQLPKFNAPSVDYSGRSAWLGNLPEVLSTFQDFQTKQAQIDNLRAQNRVIQETAGMKSIANEFARDSYSDRLGILDATQRGKHVDAASKWYLYTGGETGRDDPRTKGLQDYMLEYASGKNRAQSIQMQKMIEDMNYQKLQNEWYTTKLFGQLGMQAVKTISGLIPSNIGRKAAGNLVTGNRGINQRTGTPAYNSTESWRKMGY